VTLPKRKSRTIEVEKVRYRYIISKSGTASDGCYALNLTIQVEGGPGCILKVEGLSTRDPWLDFPQLDSADKYLGLRPQHVAALIKLALAKGWTARQTGTPFHLDGSEAKASA